MRYVQKEGPQEFRDAGFEVSVPDGHIPLPDGTDLAHARDRATAINIASQWISDDAAIWYAQHICLFGTPDEIAERALAFGKLGVNELVMGTGSSFLLPSELIEMVGSEVLPRLQEAAPVMAA